mmetsp:Transcript_37202/g.120143  ORF Transcript_37202/g.120143 Transcript_37202/m.120143 type:complete len:230 (+) Transcript_37202:104-793(+)
MAKRNGPSGSPCAHPSADMKTLPSPSRASSLKRKRRRGTLYHSATVGMSSGYQRRKPAKMASREMELKPFLLSSEATAWPGLRRRCSDRSCTATSAPPARPTPTCRGMLQSLTRASASSSDMPSPPSSVGRRQISRMPSTMRRRVSAVRPVKRSHMSELRCFMRTRLARRRIAAGMPMGRVPVRLPLSSRFSIPSSWRSPQSAAALSCTLPWLMAATMSKRTSRTSEPA